jgi:leader peptidase (prepilin peptidase) / N-methyltransferase
LLSALGAILGSFIAALCSRWATGESISAGRSRCERCGKNVASYDLIPVISYLLLRGKCRNCGQPIGLRPLAIELVAASIGAVSAILFPADQAIAAAIFGWLLLPLIILDFDHLWLPDRLILMLAVAALIAGPALAPEVRWPDRAIGLLCGFASLEIIRRAYLAYRQREGMGAGDPKLFGAIGLWLGWQALPLILLVASLIGLGCVAAQVRHPSLQTAAFPLGSYLGIASFLLALSV